MSVVHNRVVRGRYLDSVSLMRVSQSLSALPGVDEAAVMIGSDTNKRLMRDSGLLASGDDARPSDLVVGVRAADDAAAQAALAALDDLLAHKAEPAAAGPGGVAVRTLAGALQALPGASIAIVSVPGEFAAAEAARALRAGLNVLLFSNNVALEDERRLKLLARERGLLLMGADCGTSLIGGVPLAFANVVPRGGVGVVAASGTGLQEVTTLIGRAGGGISHGIGVGGRDLRDEIGGITTLMAIDALDADRATQHIVLVSKPPAPRVAAAVLARIAQSGKPFTVCLLGEAGLSLPPNAGHARTLREAAERALGSGPLAPRFVADARLPRQGAGRYVRGLYCGGTLCAEAQLVLRAAGEAVASNAPVPGAQTLADAARMHSIVDLGADEYTRGRPHPMIEPSIRNEPLRAAMADPATAVVLVDVVIGYGAHPDPAGVLARALGAARNRHAGDAGAGERAAGGHPAGAPASSLPPVIASVTGTEADPQVYSHQVRTLREAGVIVAPSNAHAAELALAALRAAG